MTKEKGKEEEPSMEKCLSLMEQHLKDQQEEHYKQIKKLLFATASLQQDNSHSIVYTHTTTSSWPTTIFSIGCPRCWVFASTPNHGGQR